MSDAGFDEQGCVEGMRRRKFMTGVANYHIYKAEICFFYGNYAEALSHVRAQDKLIASAMSLPQLVRFYVVAFLTLDVYLPGMDPLEQINTRKRLRPDLKRLYPWATHCPANFLHHLSLLESTIAPLT